MGTKDEGHLTCQYLSEGLFHTRRVQRRSLDEGQTVITSHIYTYHIIMSDQVVRSERIG